MSCCTFLERTSSVWFVSVFVALGVALVWCVATQSSASYPSTEAMLDMARDMVGLLGVIAAILIAVITSIFVLGDQKREAGYSLFFQALNGVRRLPDEIARSREAIDPGDVGSARRWAALAMQFIESMNLVTRAWKGFDGDPESEDTMQRYTEESFAAQRLIAGNLGDASDGWQELLRLQGYQEENLRGMVTGLNAMDSGIVMRRFASRLISLSISLAFLLLLALAVRTLVGVGDPAFSYLVAWLGPFLYLFFPITVIMHVLGIFCAASVWHRANRDRAKAWEMEVTTPELM